MKRSGQHPPAPGQGTEASAGDAADGLDPARLQHLLDLAGAAVATELLDRLTEDLSGVATALAAAVPLRDTVQIRAQSHVLISLSGAVGATRLQHLAEDLNAAAHAADPEAIDRLSAQVARLLARLREDVARARSARGAGA